MKINKKILNIIIISLLLLLSVFLIIILIKEKNNNTYLSLNNTNYKVLNLSNNIDEKENIPGNIIILNDGSSWYYIDSDDEYTTLLSVYFLKEDNNKLVFLNENELSQIKVSKKDEIGNSEIKPYENIYKVKFNNEDSKNNSYENSNVKKELDEKFTPNFLESFPNINIEVSLPSAEKLAKIGGIFDWTSSDIPEEGQNGFEIRLNKNILINKEVTYWLDTTNTNENKPNRAWIINLNSKLWYATTTSEYAIRPQITITNSDLKTIIKNSDETNELGLVTSPNYIIYDATENRVIKEKKSSLPNDDEDTIWPASITKLITVLYSIEKMQKENVDINDTVTVEQEMIDRIKKENPNASYAELPAGEVTYKDLIYGALFKSGLDATEQLSISLCGSEENFINEMNIFIKEILGNNSKTHFDNASGIRTDTHITTLEEFALLLDYSLDNETFKNIIKAKTYMTSYGVEFKSDSYNTLGELNNFVFSKTGHSGYSGYNYAVYYNDGNKDYIVITATANSTSNRLIDNYIIYEWLFPNTSGDLLKFNLNIIVNNNEKIIKNINIGDKIKDILKTNSKIELEDNNGIKNDSDKVLKTGQKLQLSFVNNKYDYNISVKGDTTGDGKMNVMDIVDIANHITKNKTLNGVYYISGDYDDNDNINVMDIVNIANKILNK